MIALAMATLPAQARTAQAPGLRNRSAEATLSIQTESGARKFYRLLLENDAVSLNGIPLDESSILLERKAIALAFTLLDSPEPRTCAAGIFDHEVTRGGTTRHERGCLEEPRFQALYSAFQALRESH